MKTIPSADVKKMVSCDLKERNLSQTAIAEMMGLSRGTIASIFSSKEYFSEKHATLFSLALGYNKEFLMHGNGSLLRENSEYAMKRRIKYQDERLKIFTYAEDAYYFVINHCLMNPNGDCRPLLDKALNMHNYLNTVDPIVNNNSKPYDPELMEAAFKVFEPIYNDIIDYAIDNL